MFETYLYLELGTGQRFGKHIYEILKDHINTS